MAKLPKLIRDKIPEIIEAKGEKANTHVADEEEYWKFLLGKLEEEKQEFLDVSSEMEFIDVLEVLDAIAEFKGWKKEEIEALKNRKVEKNGAFKKRLILDSIDK